MIRILLYILLLFPLMYINNYAHEKAHKAIFDRRNINSIMKVSIFSDSYCESDKDTKDTNMSNDIVDAIGYQTFPIIFLIWVIGLFMVV